jgi:UDP-2,3-diacylglucosamine hydrolase
LHRIYLASDLHLGAPNQANSRVREARFVQWLEEAASGTGHALREEATEIHLVGDLFDFWFEYRHAVPKGSVRLLGAIAKIADSGIPVHFHVGNHDLWTFGYLEDELGISVYREPIFRNYDGLRCLIGHGDGLGPGDASYKRLKKVFTSPLLQRAYRLIHPDIGIPLASYFSRNSRASQGPQEDTYSGPEGEWLWQYCREALQTQNIDCFFFGHRHLPLDLDVPHPIEGMDNARYINMGDWLHHFSSARVINGIASLDKPQ